jgi:hypothetical protein
MRMKKVRYFYALLFIALSAQAYAQEDLNKLLDTMDDSENKKVYVTGAFKATTVINLQSLEKKATGALEFRIAHRFGSLDGGSYQIFGLDQATMRMSLEYGINRFICAGVGRSTYEKTFDFYAKSIIVQQQRGSRSIPFSLLYYVNMAINGLKWQDPARENYFSSRLSYVHQIIIGSKVSKPFSFQLSPTLVHKNLLPTNQDQNGRAVFGRNNRYALGFAGRVKITKSTAITAEYIYRFPPEDRNARTWSPFYNSLSFGVDIETGGHVFQLHLSNSSHMFDRAFITETGKSWADGGIHFGFNITRDFTLKRKTKS